MSKITFPGGSTGGGGGGTNDHGALAGLGDNDHTQYLLRSDYVSSGTSAGYGIFTEASGAQLSDHGQLDGLADDDHTQYTLADGTRAFTGTVSGEADLGVATQLWVSGIPVGDFLSPGYGGSSGIGSVIVSGTQSYPTNLTINGQGNVVVSTDGASAITISGAAASASVDLTAVSTNITPDTSGAYEVGDNALSFASGYFDEIILRDGAGIGWRLTVATDGTLSTTSI